MRPAVLMEVISALFVEDTQVISLYRELMYQVQVPALLEPTAVPTTNVAELSVSIDNTLPFLFSVNTIAVQDLSERECAKAVQTGTYSGIYPTGTIDSSTAGFTMADPSSAEFSRTDSSTLNDVTDSLTATPDSTAAATTDNVFTDATTIDRSRTVNSGPTPTNSGTTDSSSPSTSAQQISGLATTSNPAGVGATMTLPLGSPRPTMNSARELRPEFALLRTLGLGMMAILMLQ